MTQPQSKTMHRAVVESSPGPCSWFSQWRRRTVAVGCLTRTPKAVYAAACALLSLPLLLAGLSVAIAKVWSHQGYTTVALAKPAAEVRMVRQTEVARFGSKVSSAFGIADHVATEFADWILEAAERQDIAPELLASLLVTESSFRKSVRSSVGAVGPAQVRPDYWGAFCGSGDLTDPEQNVYCGAQVLSHMMERCEGDTRCALAAYNVGPYAKRHSAAARYVRKVDGYLASLEAQAL